MNITTAINLVENNVSSIFTKQDVLDLLKRVSAGGNTKTIDEDVLDDIAERVAYSLDTDILELDSAEFELVGNEITLSHIDLDCSYIKDVVYETMYRAFQK